MNGAISGLPQPHDCSCTYGSGDDAGCVEGTCIDGCNYLALDGQWACVAATSCSGYEGYNETVYCPATGTTPAPPTTTEQPQDCSCTYGSGDETGCVEGTCIGGCNYMALDGQWACIAATSCSGWEGLYNETVYCPATVGAI